jgi:hypothetical protein
MCVSYSCLRALMHATVHVTPGVALVDDLADVQDQGANKYRTVQEASHDSKAAAFSTSCDMFGKHIACPWKCE